MKHVAVILALIALGWGYSFAQKGKIKGDAPPQNPDSVAAAGAGKAAIRGNALMQEARDSLRASDVTRPTDVVDTFGVEEVVIERPRYFLSKSDLVNAYYRIAESKAQLEDAQIQLQAAQAEKRFSVEKIEQAQKRLDMQKQQLAATEEKYKALCKDWEAMTGLTVMDVPTDEATQPDSSPASK